MKSENPNQIFKQIRADTNLSQTDFGEFVGLVKQNVSAIETGKTKIGLNLLQRVAKFHGYKIKIEAVKM